ncbi:MAG: hypothetical protein M1818_001860 [Claussenomyces sp. TS43310]|nr:MAG: hypothetical protein M1818_001860 [Claussenomyces sp. TS43310]
MASLHERLSWGNLIKSHSEMDAREEQCLRFSWGYLKRGTKITSEARQSRFWVQQDVALRLECARRSNESNQYPSVDASAFENCVRCLIAAKTFENREISSHHAYKEIKWLLQREDQIVREYILETGCENEDFEWPVRRASSKRKLDADEDPFVKKKIVKCKTFPAITKLLETLVANNATGTAPIDGPLEEVEEKESRSPKPAITQSSSCITPIPKSTDPDQTLAQTAQMQQQQSIASAEPLPLVRGTVHILDQTYEVSDAAQLEAFMARLTDIERIAGWRKEKKWASDYVETVVKN